MTFCSARSPSLSTARRRQRPPCLVHLPLIRPILKLRRRCLQSLVRATYPQRPNDPPIRHPRQNQSQPTVSPIPRRGFRGSHGLPPNVPTTPLNRNRPHRDPAKVPEDVCKHQRGRLAADARVGGAEQWRIGVKESPVAGECGERTLA